MLAREEEERIAAAALTAGIGDPEPVNKAHEASPVPSLNLPSTLPETDHFNQIDSVPSEKEDSIGLIEDLEEEPVEVDLFEECDDEIDKVTKVQVEDSSHDVFEKAPELKETTILPKINYLENNQKDLPLGQEGLEFSTKVT